MLSFKCERGRLGTTYTTRDGRFRVWHEPYPPRRWYVCEADGEGGYGDAHPADGFPTLSDAREYLEGKYAAEAGAARP